MLPTPRFCLLLAFIFATLISTHACTGQTTDWTNAAGGDFFDGANWSTGGPPNPGVDGIFSIPETYSVSLNLSENVKDLFFEDGNPTITGGNALSFDRIIVESSASLSPFATFDNVTLLGSEFSMLTSSNLEVQATLVNGASLSVGSLVVDAASGSPFYYEMEVRTGSSVSTGQLTIGACGLGFYDSDCIVSGECRIGPAPMDTSRLAVQNGTFVATELNLDDGLVTLQSAFVDIPMINIVDGSFNMHPDCEVDCDVLNLGDEATFGNMRVSPGSNSIIHGTINVTGPFPLSTIWLNASILEAQQVNLDGSILELHSAEGIVENSGLVSPLTMHSESLLRVVDETVGAINGGVQNHGCEVSVEAGSELTFFGNYMGQNEFVGEGTKKFRGQIHPDDLDESADDMIGTLTFVDGNAVLMSQARYVVNFLGSMPSVAHDKIVTDSSLLIQNAQLSVVPDPSEAYSFANGEVLEIIQVGETQSGQFGGFPEGSVVWSDGDYELTISYVGGDGNDVTLTASVLGVLLGDVNLDGVVNLLDVAPFVDLLSQSQFQAEADINQDGSVDLLDVAPFVTLLGG